VERKEVPGVTSLRGTFFVFTIFSTIHHLGEKDWTDVHLAKMLGTIFIIQYSYI
jgi:hypothetical protein